MAFRCKGGSLARRRDLKAVFSDVNGGGIGVVKEIDGDEMYYTLFNPKTVYHKKVKDVIWNERNWRWETAGTGFMRRLGTTDRRSDLSTEEP